MLFDLSHISMYLLNCIYICSVLDTLYSEILTDKSLVLSRVARETVNQITRGKGLGL